MIPPEKQSPPQKRFALRFLIMLGLLFGFVLEHYWHLPIWQIILWWAALLLVLLILGVFDDKNNY